MVSTYVIDERLHKGLRGDYEKFSAENELPTTEQLNQYYQTFRHAFGPERLLALEGEELLFTLKGGKEHNGLSYWLEFKNDDEFRSGLFGSIAGGSAYKFGLFRRGDTGTWSSGTIHREKEVTQEDAIKIARQQRNELVEGCRLLETLPLESDSDYSRLQREIMRVAPLVADTTWGHKYFSLLYPDKLEDFHVYSYQYFYMLKLLQSPPAEMGTYERAGRYYAMGGRYLMGGQYARIARSLGIPIHILTRLLTLRNGPPYRYWRIGSTSGGNGKSFWQEMLEGNHCAVGWLGTSDLSPLLTLSTQSERKQRLREIATQTYPNDNAATITKVVNQLLSFIFLIEERDLVLVSEGVKVLGIGQITGDYYYYDPTKGFPHCRPVQWLSLKEWQQSDRDPDFEGKLTTVHEMKRPQNLLAAERQIFDSGIVTVTAGNPPEGGDGPENPGDETPDLIPDPPIEIFTDSKLASIPEIQLRQRIAQVRHAILVEEKLVKRIYYALLNGHVILAGPPGTGKTELARLIPEILWQDEKQELLDPDEVGGGAMAAARNALPAGYATTLVTATSEWSTQTLISRIVPVIEEKNVAYRTQHGYLTEAILRNWAINEDTASWEILGRRSLLAHTGPDQQEERRYRGHWLVIDEFNRAPIDAALGEALTALGSGEALHVVIDGRRELLPLPSDFRIIGTLNSFDRNYLNQLSEALKRRFSFIEVPPPSRRYRQAEQGIVLYKALKHLAHHSSSIRVNEDGVIWNTVVSVQANADGIYEVVWQDEQHPFFPIFTRQLWPLFETIRVYRQLGTAQAIALTRQVLTQGLLQEEETDEGWQEALDIAFCDTIADQLQVLLSDELDILSWCLKGDAAQFIDKYRDTLAEFAGRKRRLVAHMEALSTIVTEQGEPLLSDEAMEELLEQKEPDVSPEVLHEAFHLEHIPYKLPQFSRRLRNFKAVHGL